MVGAPNASNPGIRPGGNKYEMRQETMTEREVEAALTVGAGSEFEMAARFACLLEAGTEPMPERIAAHQIRVMAEAAALATSAGSGLGRVRSRRRWVTASLSAGFGWKLLIASAALAATGAAAATGSLPDPVQAGLSEAASLVGIQLPDGQAGVDESGQVGTLGEAEEASTEDQAGIGESDQTVAGASDQAGMDESGQAVTEVSDQTTPSDASGSGTAGDVADGQTDGVDAGQSDQPGAGPN